jgi:hypothetical protein
MAGGRDEGRAGVRRKDTQDETPKDGTTLKRTRPQQGGGWDAEPQGDTVAASRGPALPGEPNEAGAESGPTRAPAARPLLEQRRGEAPSACLPVSPHRAFQFTNLNGRLVRRPGQLSTGLFPTQPGGLLLALRPSLALLSPADRGSLRR